MTSERAEGRQRDLRGETIDRLQSHPELVDLLTQVGEDESAIVPTFRVKRLRNDDNAPNPPSVAIAVSVVTGSSERINRLEQRNMTVQVELEFRPGIKPDIGTLPWCDAVADEISAVLTAHTDGWTAEGETGGTPEPLWNEDRNRYVLAKRFDVRRID